MNRLIPTRVELALFAILAVAGAVGVSFFGAHEVGLAVLALPVFCIAAFMGTRRSGQWASLDQPAEPEPVPVDEAIE
jgi:hypothetical protein